MKKILFVTGNGRKFWQASEATRSLGIELEQLEIELDEIQSHDPLEISVAKAKHAFEKVQKPLIVNDYSWSITALKGFPGGYMKDMVHWLEAEDFLNLMQGKKDRTFTLTDTVVYIDSDGHNVFQQEFHGKIIDEPRGIGNVSIDRVAIFDGQGKTIAEHVDAHELSRNTDKTAFRAFGEWFSASER